MTTNYYSQWTAQLEDFNRQVDAYNVPEVVGLLTAFTPAFGPLLDALRSELKSGQEEANNLLPVLAHLDAAPASSTDAGPRLLKMMSRWERIDRLNTLIKEEIAYVQRRHPRLNITTT